MRNNHNETIVLQRSKLVAGLLCIVTVSRFPILEEWRVYLHICKSSRTYSCKIYDSDLFNISENAINVEYFDTEHIVNRAKEDIKAWEIIVNECYFETYESKDLLFRFDNISADMRELLYAQHIALDFQLFYFEVLIKSNYAYNQKFLGVKSMEEAKRFLLTFRAYSFRKGIWIKTSLKLDECLLLLINEGYLEENILLNFYIGYSDLQLYAGILCRLVKMKNKHQKIRQKLLPDISLDTEDEDMQLFEEKLHKNKQDHSLSSIYEKDEFLYESVYQVFPPSIVSVFYNDYLEEFIIKVYLKKEGSMLRQPFAKKVVFKEIPFSENLLDKKVYKSLGRRILNLFLPKVIENI